MLRLRLPSLALGTALCALPLLLGACSSSSPGALGTSAQAAAAAPAPPTGREAIGAAETQDDWGHTLQVIANLRADPPDLPVVYLLGGSVARECIVSEQSWAAAVADAGGPTALTYDLASSNRTTATDLKLVAAMPKVPTIVFIGVNVGRFTPAPSTPSVTLPAPSETVPPWEQHRYSDARSVAAKESLLRGWLRTRYPLFKKHYAYNRGMLEKLVKACKAKGFRPVLLELPRNTAVVKSRLDAPVARYHRSCKALAAEYRIPWVNFVGAAKLKNGDFHDLWHLIDPGRRKWQPLLAAKTAALLKKYGMATPSPSPTPSGSPVPAAPSPSGSPSP